MNGPDNQKIAAYLDHELSLEEAASFEKALSGNTLENLQAEMKLEAGIAGCLEAPGCPDILWKQLRRQMKSTARPTILHFLKKKYVWFALAASLTAVAGFYIARPQPAFLNNVSTVTALQAEAVMKSPAATLADSGFNLSITPMPPDAHHNIKLLGGYTTHLAGAPVAVICVNCCGKPLRILVTQKGSRAAKMLLRERYQENLQTVVWRGKYQLAVIGTHPAEETLNLFKQV